MKSEYEVGVEGILGKIENTLDKLDDKTIKEMKAEFSEEELKRFEDLLQSISQKISKL